MRVTIDIRDDWVSDVAHAVSDAGSNDQEHGLLMEMVEQVAVVTGYEFWDAVDALERGAG